MVPNNLLWMTTLFAALFVLSTYGFDSDQLLTKIRTKRIGQAEAGSYQRKSGKIQIRTKRIGTDTGNDDTKDNKRIRVRTKRIGLVDDKQPSGLVKTKKNEETKNKFKNEKKKQNKVFKNMKIKALGINNKEQFRTTSSPRTDHVTTDESMELKMIDPVSKYMPHVSTASEIVENEIGNLQKALYGFCRAQKIRQTFSAQGCENVTVETVVCGGVCQAPLQTFTDIEDIEKAFKTCKYCGPLEYEEKLVFMQCYKGTERKRRWKIAVRKMYVPKTCGCIKESCLKLNKVSAEGEWRL